MYTNSYICHIERYHYTLMASFSLAKVTERSQRTTPFVTSMLGCLSFPPNNNNSTMYLHPQHGEAHSECQDEITCETAKNCYCYLNVTMNMRNTSTCMD